MQEQDLLLDCEQFVVFVAKRCALKKCTFGRKQDFFLVMPIPSVFVPESGPTKVELGIHGGIFISHADPAERVK
jgi:hypothetical protein